MRKFIQFSLMLAIIFQLCSCAQSYYTLNPARIVYTATNNLENISLSYRYNILEEKGNKKISKNESRRNFKLVAVKITNNTDTVINIGKNAAFFNGNSIAYPMETISIKNNLQQSVASHLLYLLLSPLTLSLNDSNPFPIGLILGPAISGGNMVVAAKANKNLYKDLEKYDIIFRNIKPGETVFGLVGFRNIDYAPLSVKLIKK